ncbi:MAG: hypothetical protein ACREM2_04500 [Vulcanimicrobiaceae bacterium]
MKLPRFVFAIPIALALSFYVHLPPVSLGYSYPAAPLGTPSTYAPTCSGSVGSFGDYTINGEVFVPDDEQQIYLTGTIIFVHTVLLLTKNRAGDALIVGEVVGDQNGLMKSAATAGDSWTYTDIAGKSATATVAFDHQARSYTYPNGDPVASYPDVAEVNYGTDLTIDWAAGYGPVFLNERSAVAAEPLSYTAYGYQVVPGSK